MAAAKRGNNGRLCGLDGGVLFLLLAAAAAPSTFIVFLHWSRLAVSTARAVRSSVVRSSFGFSARGRASTGTRATGDASTIAKVGEDGEVEGRERNETSVDEPGKDKAETTRASAQTKICSKFGLKMVTTSKFALSRWTVIFVYPNPNERRRMKCITVLELPLEILMGGTEGAIPYYMSILKMQLSTSLFLRLPTLNLTKCVNSSQTLTIFS